MIIHSVINSDMLSKLLPFTNECRRCQLVVSSGQVYLNSETVQFKEGTSQDCCRYCGAHMTVEALIIHSMNHEQRNRDKQAVEIIEVAMAVDEFVFPI